MLRDWINFDTLQINGNTLNSVAASFLQIESTNITLLNLQMNNNWLAANFSNLQ